MAGKHVLPIAGVALLSVAWLTHAQDAALESWRAEVHAAERAFASSMAKRDFAAFGQFVAMDAVFFSGSATHRGRGADGWPVVFDKGSPVE